MYVVSREERTTATEIDAYMYVPGKFIDRCCTYTLAGKRPDAFGPTVVEKSYHREAVVRR